MGGDRGARELSNGGASEGREEISVGGWGADADLDVFVIKVIGKPLRGDHRGGEVVRGGGCDDRRGAGRGERAARCGVGVQREGRGSSPARDASGWRQGRRWGAEVGGAGR